MSSNQLFRWSQEELEDGRKVIEDLKIYSRRMKDNATHYRHSSYSFYLLLRNLSFFSFLMSVSSWIFLGASRLTIGMAVLMNLIVVVIYVAHEFGDYSEKWRLSLTSQFGLDNLAICVSNELDKKTHPVEAKEYFESVKITKSQILRGIV